jgi:hypothetical protein
MEYETAGDPMSGVKWTRKTTESIALELGKLNIQVSSNTVASLLREFGYSLRVNHKKIAISGNAKVGFITTMIYTRVAVEDMKPLDARRILMVNVITTIGVLVQMYC